MLIMLNVKMLIKNNSKKKNSKYELKDEKITSSNIFFSSELGLFQEAIASQKKMKS